MRINERCAVCHKLAIEVEEKIVGKVVMSKLECGHSTMRFLSEAELRAIQAPAPVTEIATRSVDGELMTEAEYQSYIAHKEELEELAQPENWRKLLEYQKEGVLFGERSNLRLLIADEPGLGKTVQAALLADRNWDTVTPLLITCPAGLTTHWYKFLVAWLGKDKYNNDKPYRSIYIHRGRNKPMLEGYNVVIIGNNLLTGEFTRQSIAEYEFKCMIADECHHFKDERAARTKAFMEIAATIPHLIALSGTPVMNRVTEYFPILHVLAPTHWPSMMQLNNLCMRDSRGKALALDPRYKEWFFNRTSKYIIRRTKKDHLKGLPSFQRIPMMVDPEALAPEKAKKFAAMYNYYLDELQEEMAATNGNILGVLSKIRRLTGNAKAELAFDEIIEQLQSDDDLMSKIVVGVHHKSVADVLGELFKKYAEDNNAPEFIPLFMSGAHNVEEKDQIQNEFQHSKCRILIASILATAEGRNMQFCHKMLVAEREWNPAKEEQFEQRLHRMGQKENVTAIYYMLARTIDEWFDTLVELKRNIANSTYDASLDLDENFMRQLAEKVVQNRMKIIG